MRYLRHLRVWVGVVAVVVGAVVGLLTNIVTTELTWLVGTGLVAGVVVLAALTVVPEVRAERDRVAGLRAARAEVLEPMRPAPQGSHTISSLLAAEHALAPFRGRSTETEALTRWCLDPAGPAVHVLAGPSGVGKSRLAVEVARRLPGEWVSGWCISGQAARVVPAVLACPEPALVVVDDADTQPGVAALVQQLGRRAPHGEVKVLLLARQNEGFQTWLRQMPDAHREELPAMTLAVIGGPGDRRRWFVEAVRAYAEALGAPPPPVTDMDTRRVGAEGDPIILTQARAVLAALAGTPERADALRTASIDDVAVALVEHERQRWDRAAAEPRWRLPADYAPNDLEEALLALVLLAPPTFDAAVGALRRLPLFREQPEPSLRHLVHWAHHLYPGAGPAQVEPAPDFLRDALLAGLARPTHAELAATLLSASFTENPDEGAGVLMRLVRASTLFVTVAPLVGTVLQDQPALLPAAIDALVLTGPAARIVEPRLVAAVTPGMFTAPEVDRLLDLLAPTLFTALRAALQELAVQHARDVFDKQNTDEARAALAAALHNLGVSLWALGRYEPALAAAEEAVLLRRELVAQNPARYTPDLATSLTNQAIMLCDLGRHDEELELRAERVACWRILARRNPDRHKHTYEQERNRLVGHFTQHGHHPETAWRAEEDLAGRLDGAS